jgi:hypothetical protein
VISSGHFKWPWPPEARLIGDIAGRRDESGGFSVKIGDLRFKLIHGVAIAADIPRTTSTSAIAARG